MTGHLAQQYRWLSGERVPGYAPALNPAEGLWGNLKGLERAHLSHLCPGCPQQYPYLAPLPAGRETPQPASGGAGIIFTT